METAPIPPAAHIAHGPRSSRLSRLLLALCLLALPTPSLATDIAEPAAPFGDPRQVELTDPGSWTLGAYTVTPLATYDLTAVVLGSRTYSSGREADTSPIDFALGWGAMADPTVLSSYDSSQRDRWYYVRWSRSPIAREEIVRSSANTHLLPATPELARQLATVRPGQAVRLRGYLVEVSASDGWRWRSSLTRDDTGQGSCEVIWVEALEVEPPPGVIADH